MHCLPIELDRAPTLVHAEITFRCTPSGPVKREMKALEVLSNSINRTTHLNSETQLECSSSPKASHGSGLESIESMGSRLTVS